MSLGTGQPRLYSLSNASRASSIHSTSSSRREPNREYFLVNNRGSTARDYLGLERTFLAWIRLALSLFTVGVVMALDFNVDKLEVNVDKKRISLILGSIVAVSSVFALMIVLQRFLITQKRLADERRSMDEGAFIRWTFIILLAIGAVTAVVAYILDLTIH